MDFDSIVDDSQQQAAAATPTPQQPTPSAQAQPPTQAAAAPTDLNFDDIQDDSEKYGTATEMLKTGIEGIAKGALGPIATAAETAIFQNEDKQRIRAQVNPVTHVVTEMTGLAGTALAGVGLGGTLAKVGEAVGAGTEALGIGRLGSSVAKSAVENLVFQAGDEASRLILKDPDQSAETAVADMGLAALIGGGFGTVSPLWHATMGEKAGGILKAVSNKFGGIEGVVPDAVKDHIAKAGLDVPPAVKAALSDNPYVQQAFKTLEQSDTTSSGLELQKTYRDFRKQMGDALAGTLGRNPEEVGNEISKHGVGKAIGNTLAEEYSTQLNPLSKVFDELKTKFKGVELPGESVSEAGVKTPGTIDKAIGDISKMAIDEGWAASPSSDIMREVNRVVKELPLQKNLKNLSDYITQIGSNTNPGPPNGPLRRAGAMMSRVLKDAEGDVMAAKLGEKEGPEALQAFKMAREGYKTQSALKDALDSRLSLRSSTSGYAKALNEMAQTDSETLLRRLSGTNDADLLNFIQQNYPKTAELIKNYHINDLLKSASDKAKSGMNVNSEALLLKLNKMSPELRNFIASPDAQSKIGAIDALISRLNDRPHNFSNTARTADQLLQWVPSAIVAAIALVHGVNPAAAILTGALAKAVSKDAPDAIRLGLLKFLGSDKQIDSAGFKAMIDFIDHTVKGENLLAKATKNVFKAGTEVIPASQMPTEKDRNKIKKSMSSMTNDPKQLLDITGKTGHYLPDHTTALTQTAANALQFLNSQKPNIDKASPFDTQRKPNAAESAQYERALDIAQQPLMVLKHIAEGKITPQDVLVQRALYPALYQRTVQKLSEHMAEVTAKGQSIPYKTRLGLGLYMGQSLDSTMTPANIIAAQPQPPTAQPQTAMQPASNPKKNPAGINKMPNMFRTQGQSAEQDRAKRQNQ